MITSRAAKIHSLSVITSSFKKMTVFVPNDAGHDYDIARQYGELVFLTSGVVRKFDAQKLYRRISEKMENTDADDYLMIGSLPILNAIAAAVQAKRHGRVNFLFYRGGRYVERSVRVT